MTNRPIVAVLPVNGGYYLIGADGGVFAFGEAVYHGSLPGHSVALKDDALIVDAALAPDAKGYLLVGADGGVFAFGSAHYFGSIPGAKLAADHPHAGPVPVSHVAAHELDASTNLPTPRAQLVLAADAQGVDSHLSPPGSSPEAQQAAGAAAPAAPPPRF